MKNILVLTALLFAVSATRAQKIPNIQTASLKAPANVKVDGKATEWGEMQAYNHATDVAYTIANDANNLYLVVQSKDPVTITRIVNGRVTLTVSKTGKKSDNGTVSISYPVFEKGDRPSLSIREKLTTSKIADSLMLLNNQRLTTKAKLIKVTGVQGLDTLISVYNDNGIKAASAFDNKLLYTCEISVSLKLLGLSAADATKLAYNVRLNGVASDDVPGVNIKRGSNGEITAINIVKTDMIASPQIMTATTDFWGEYTLVR